MAHLITEPAPWVFTAAHLANQPPNQYIPSFPALMAPGGPERAQFPSEFSVAGPTISCGQLAEGDSPVCMGTGEREAEKQGSLGTGALPTALSPAAAVLSCWGHMVMSAQLGTPGKPQLESAAGMAERGAGQRRAGHDSESPGHLLLQISISTMSDKSWTLDVATESGESQEHSTCQSGLADCSLHPGTSLRQLFLH